MRWFSSWFGRWFGAEDDVVVVTRTAQGKYAVEHAAAFAGISSAYGFEVDAASALVDIRNAVGFEAEAAGAREDIRAVQNGFATEHRSALADLMGGGF